MRVLEGRPTQLSFENHFEFGYSNADQFGGVEVPFSVRTSAEDMWFVRYGRAQRFPFDFRKECIETARRIRESTKLPIDVLFSGGVDSEVALRSFLEAGIDIRVSTLRFKDDLNRHDVEWAERVGRELGLTIRFVDLDLLKFWETEALAYADRTQCVSPQLLTTMWLADQTDGFCVLGSGENFIVKRLPEDYVPGESPYLRSVWDLFEKEKIAAWYRHFQLQGRDAAPGFFQYTPEIMLSWFLDPIGCDLWNDRRVGKRNSESSKLEQYQQHFPLAARPKYTGFEKVAEQDKVFRAELRRRHTSSDFIIATPVPTLVQSMIPLGSESLAREYISEFSNPTWGSELNLSVEMPMPRLIDGWIYYR